MVARLLVIGILLAGLTTACSRQAPIDLQQLEGQARAGDAEAISQLVSLLGRAENDLNDRAYAIVVDLGDAVVPHLLRQLENAGDVQREYLVAALGNAKTPKAVTPLARILADRSLSRRYVAAWALGEIGGERSAEALVAALDDPEPEVRRHATRALISINRPALPPLLDFLSQANGEAEAAAIRALGDIADPRSLEPLLERVEGENRAEAFLALGKLKDPRAEQALLSGLDDADWRIRMNAAMALGPVGTEEAVSPLEGTLEDEVLVVREWSARSLEMITGRHYTYRDAEGQQVKPYNIYH